MEAACWPQTPISLFKGTPDFGDGPGGERDLDRVVLHDHDKGFRRQLACQACKSPVTFDEARLEMNQKHQHTFFNPQGFVYRVSCFQVAPGTVSIGNPSEEFSWFAGYRWQIALCSSCQVHLGWSFSGSGTFFGLIENRLVEIEREDG